MSSLSGLPTPPPYNFDDTLPPMTLEMYANDLYNDCVIAARAHHTIRLVWDSSRQLLHISDKDVTNEYSNETGGPDNGLDLKTSLDAWQKPGWTIGPDQKTMRQIKSHSASYSISGGAFPGNDPTKVLSKQQLQADIFSSIGAQVNLYLPKDVSVNNSKSFGPGHPWQNPPDADGDAHVMLLTGYTADGFIGITWAQRQEMTWEFLQSNCWGVFFVEKGETT
jgi:hypothetical protein